MISNLQTMLTQDGIARIAPMPRWHALEIVDFLTQRGQRPGHVAASPADAVTCWTMDDVLQAPHLFEFALSLTGLAGEYLGRAPVLYSLNAFTTYPADGPTLGYIQDFHRDKDDDHFVALFVYLTDIPTSSDGPHQFQAGTHRGLGAGEVITVVGPAGTAFLADPSGLHRGVRPLHYPRTLAWARWGISEHPIAYDWDRLSPAPRALIGDRYPSDPLLRESIRLVVR